MSAALDLKRLRQAAKPTMSVRRLAEALEIPPNTYARYEDPALFKKRHLPLDFARRVAAILADYDVDPADVLKLAGVGAAESQKIELSAAEEQLLQIYRQLAADRRQLLLQVAAAISSVVPAGATLHESESRST